VGVCARSMKGWAAGQQVRTSCTRRSETVQVNCKARLMKGSSPDLFGCIRLCFVLVHLK